MAWTEFALALASFYLTHLIPSLGGLRQNLIDRLGRGGYGAAYGLVSLGLLGWLILAAERAPVVSLWEPALWTRWLVALAMPAAVLLVTLSVGAPNPLSFGGRAGGFDPARPGIAGVVRHPLLWALLLWAGSHLLANGDLAHVLMFGGFALWSALAMPLIDRRQRRRLGERLWITRASATSNWPFRGNWRSYRPPVLRLVLAVLIWLALLYMHPRLIGMSPLP